MIGKCLGRRREEVFVHFKRAGQQLVEMIHTDTQGYTQANRRPQRIATPDPVPKSKHIGRVNTKLTDFGFVGG
jgi:hypothetical protein